MLPDELLLSIARNRCDNVDLRRLALSCRKLRTISQEILFKEVVLNPNRMVRLIRTLCDRPDLCEKISSVDLGSYAITEPPEALSDITKWRHFSKCRDIVAAALFDKIVNYEHADDVHQPWSKSHRFFLSVLIASCRNIKKLSLILPASEQDPLSIISGGFDHKRASIVPCLAACLRAAINAILALRDL